MLTSITLSMLLFSEGTIAEDMHKEAIRIRNKYGLPSQKLDESLCAIAQNWAENMAHRKKMYHGGNEQIIASGYSTISGCFAGWNYSRGHCAWLLSRSSLAGWGAAQSSSGRWYYAGCFYPKQPRYIPKKKKRKRK